MYDELESLVKEKYPDAIYLDEVEIEEFEILGKLPETYEKLCYVASTDCYGIVECFEVAYISKDKKYWTWISQQFR